MSFSRLSLGATFPQSLALFKAYIKKKKKKQKSLYFSQIQISNSSGFKN